MIRIAGGWGYYNLGDEAILAGYVQTLSGIDSLQIVSINPRRTERAQLNNLSIVGETNPSTLLQRKGDISATILGGGGYLNGHWTPEIYFKLMRLGLLRQAGSVIGHGLELRKLDGFPTKRLATELFEGSRIAVRDAASAREAAALGLQADQLPDSISLLAPHIDSYITKVTDMRGRVLLNLLDIGARSDSVEAEIEVSRWKQFCTELVRKLGGRAVALVVGAGDRQFAQQIPGLPIVEPKSVVQLASVIANADAILSVRMHPALIGTIVGTPTVSIPYCGKVSPTLRTIGVDDVLMRNLTANEAMERLQSPPKNFSNEWTSAAAKNTSWLLDAMEFCR